MARARITSFHETTRRGHRRAPLFARPRPPNNTHHDRETEPEVYRHSNVWFCSHRRLLCLRKQLSALWLFDHLRKMSPGNTPQPCPVLGLDQHEHDLPPHPKQLTSHLPGVMMTSSASPSENPDSRPRRRPTHCRVCVRKNICLVIVPKGHCLITLLLSSYPSPIWRLIIILDSY
jgi:hypothetical protein